MTGRSRAVVIAMMLWWAFFGCVSVSWALGSPWLVDTALQGNALRLAQERPTWIIVVVLISGLVKLSFVVFGFALLRPDIIRVPRWMRLAFGWVSGALLMAYGLIGSAPAIPRLLSGQPSGWAASWCWPQRSPTCVGAGPSRFMSARCSLVAVAWSGDAGQPLEQGGGPGMRPRLRFPALT